MGPRIAHNISAAIQLSAGIGAVVLGLIVIVGWQSGSPVLTQVRPGLPAMQYVNALAFVIAGVGLLSAGSGRDEMAGIAGLVTGAIGILSLTQDLLEVDPGIDLFFGVTTYLTAGAATPARMPPNAALCFALAGTGLFLRRATTPGRVSMPTSFLGATTAALGLVAVVGYASDLVTAYGWGQLTSMAMHTAIGFLLVGSGLAARGWRDAPTVSATRLPALVGVASLTASIAIWHALAGHDRERTFQLIRTHAAYLRAAFAEPLDAQARALERMTYRLAAAPGADAWAAEARRHLADFDAALSVERVHLGTGASSIAADAAGAPEMPPSTREYVLQMAVSRPAVSITSTQIADGSGALVLTAPVRRSGVPEEVVVATLLVERLVARALAGQEQFGYGLAILDGVRQVHGGDPPDAAAEAWITEVDLAVRQAPLRLRVWPTPAQLAQLEGRMPSLMLVTGLMVSALLTSMTFFAGTSRRRERQLREAAHELRASEQRYREARDAALESDRLKSEFVANVSHELRTPMNGILGLTELLLETDLTPEQRDHAATVRECGETLLVLLNDILDLSKVAAGKLEIATVAFEPRRLVQQTADLFGDRARRKGLDLVCLVHHDVPEAVEGDPGRVRQVLTNLLGNAVKFTDSGEIAVRVTAGRASDDTVLLRIEVTDTGIGIGPEACAQIFQPFVQADGSITRKYGGTGLGLVISKQLAELMGGGMGMSSQRGKGSTFWFTVLTTVVATPAVRGAAHDGLAGLRVLVLKDSAAGRRRLCEVLAAWGMTATEAPSSGAALDLLKTAAARGEPFDAILVELHSPSISAFDFAEAAHAAGLVPPARLILISGRGEPGDAQRARDLGAAAYLTHPISQSDLFDCLATVFGEPSPEAAPAEEPAPLVTRYTLEKRQDPLREPLLVVEDNVVNQKVMVGLLRKLGYRADVANNGSEALEALQRTPYRLVLMDSQMPGMDGFATTAEIRRREGEGEGRRTVIVCVTAHAMKGERERCLAAGMDDYLSKPVSFERLAAVLEGWLGRPSAPPPATVQAQPIPSPEGPVLDPQALERLRELEQDVPGLVADVVTTFLRETSGRIERIRSAFAAGDAAALERAAHGLKGSAGAVGAERLVHLCTGIERCGREQRPDACGGSVAALEVVFEEVRTILQRDYLTAIAQ